MRYVSVILMLLAVVGMPILAQPAPADLESEMAATQLKFEEWVAATKAFIGSTTFNNDDIRSFIELWPELAAIDEEEDDEEMVDYKQMLNDPLYREFAGTHGLNAESWLKKSIRILTLVMKEQMAIHMAAAEAQLPQQRQMIEKQKAQLGEQTYENMKSTLEASAAIMKRQREIWAGMPEPTASERALLATYRDELTALMMGDDEEEEWQDEEWQDEEWEDEE